MELSRTKKSFLNAIMMVLNTGVLSVLSLISTNLILKNYGSDFNGVVATANQFVNLLLIVEGGFTTAINVALFKPFVKNDTKKINQIMSAAKKTFTKIGLIFLIISIISSLIYPLFIKSGLGYITIFLIFLMVMLGTSYNLIFVIRHQIMFQVSQKEYLYTFYSVIVNVLSSLTTIILAYLKVDMLIIRLFILLYIIINGIVIYILYKNTFKDVKSNEKPDYAAIKGTKDIMVQKLTSVVYMSAPLLFISTFISTKMASVYSVYNSIYNIIKSFLSSMIAAPVNGFGQLLSEGKNEEVYKKFEIYEFIVILVATILISSVLVMIIPFIKLYTASVTDINYVNIWISILLASIVLTEVIHIPSGNIINVTGNFKVAKKIQTIASILLIGLLIIGGYFFNIYGILGATLITNIVLASMEIYYAHIKIFDKSVKSFIIRLSINLIIIIVDFIVFYFVNLNINSYIAFFGIGFVVLIINIIIILFINVLFFREYTLKILNMIKGFIVRKI